MAGDELDPQGSSWKLISGGKLASRMISCSSLTSWAVKHASTPNREYAASGEKECIDAQC
ncbi:uncharacterized protein CIMG_06765 [Coccidioides immitis RS]|uniref:Uncharacterized protein n=3 Tax=Coccidioides immitis TaxID=5501 RepID=J3K8V5_COCIM|nr:uncharacterized protein CIMG_06765 [Coccidioides immitis RS]EAS31286.3 hypothetical protein CIMG_06765 [Coccidioides immitis RS]